jgi:hypothetical protein
MKHLIALLLLGLSATAEAAVSLSCVDPADPAASTFIYVSDKQNGLMICTDGDCWARPLLDYQAIDFGNETTMFRLLAGDDSEAVRLTLIFKGTTNLIGSMLNETEINCEFI